MQKSQPYLKQFSGSNLGSNKFPLELKLNLITTKSKLSGDLKVWLRMLMSHTIPGLNLRNFSAQPARCRRSGTIFSQNEALGQAGTIKRPLDLKCTRRRITGTISLAGGNMKTE